MTKEFLDFTIGFPDLKMISFFENCEGYGEMEYWLDEDSKDARILRNNIKELEKYERSKQNKV